LHYDYSDTLEQVLLHTQRFLACQEEGRTFKLFDSHAGKVSLGLVVAPDNSMCSFGFSTINANTIYYSSYGGHLLVRHNVMSIVFFVFAESETDPSFLPDHQVYTDLDQNAHVQTLKRRTLSPSHYPSSSSTIPQDGATMALLKASSRNKQRGNMEPEEKFITTWSVRISLLRNIFPTVVYIPLCTGVTG